DNNLARPLLLHWDGNTWNVVASPPLSRGGLTSVSMISANDIWAIGGYSSGSTLFLHWDGSAWSQIDGPGPGDFNDLRASAAISSDDVWAMGYYLNNGEVPGHTLVMHWDGSAWSYIPSPDPGAWGNEFFGAAAVSGQDVWAVGDWFDYFNGPYHSLA